MTQTYLNEGNAAQYVIDLLKAWGYINVKVTLTIPQYSGRLWWKKVESIDVYFIAEERDVYATTSGMFSVWVENGKLYGEW